MIFGDPASIDPALDCRAVTFENPTGARGAGGAEADGRKGAPSRTIKPGERVTLCDLDGPGRVTHFWCTVPPAPPEAMRALLIEGFYDGHADPSIAVPLVDLFGVPHGRPVAYTSAMAAIQEGRGFNLYWPIPLGEHLRLEFENGSDRNVELYYQLDYVLAPDPAGALPSYLHVSWRRENPTVMGNDVVIAEGIHGPGRFAGCNIGVRVLDGGIWYGEGEVKVYRDGDGELPTICGTGLEDYVGTAWGMGRHEALWAGSPLDVRESDAQVQPDYLGFYRWHVPDPIMFGTDLSVTIQQIGAAMFFPGQEEEFEAFAASHPVAGQGWWRVPVLLASGITERVDDYCTTAYVYASEPQAVPRVDRALACADLDRMPYEKPSMMELLLNAATGTDIEVFRPR